jgi:phosphate uptake regulator
MEDEPLVKPENCIRRAAQTAQETMTGSLEPVIDRDVACAKVIPQLHKEEKLLCKAIFDELMEIEAKSPLSAARAPHLISAAFNLPWIGDRATEFAEGGAFIMAGQMRSTSV